MKPITILCLLALLFPLCIRAQQKNEKQAQPAAPHDTLYYIMLKNGSAVQGKLLSKDSKTMKIQSPGMGLVTIEKDSVKSMEMRLPTSYKNGSYWFKNPNSSRYFFSPSAIPMERGDGYFQDIELLFVNINYAITNNISIGAGTDVITPFISGSGGPIAFVNFKAGFKVNNWLHLGAGATGFHVPSFDVDELFGFAAYGLGTFGNTDNNITLGTGYGYAAHAGSPGPLITISGMVRATPRISFITENWAVPTHNYDYTYDYNTGISNERTYIKYNLVFSYGIRFMSEKIAVDLGFINNEDIVSLIAIGYPYVDFVIKF